MTRLHGIKSAHVKQKASMFGNVCSSYTVSNEGLLTLLECIELGCKHITCERADTAELR